MQGYLRDLRAARILKHLEYRVWGELLRLPNRVLAPGVCLALLHSC